MCNATFLLLEKAGQLECTAPSLCYANFLVALCHGKAEREYDKFHEQITRLKSPREWGFFR